MLGIGGDATQAELNRVTALVVGRDGLVHLASSTEVFRVNQDGVLELLVDLAAGEYDGSVAPYTSPAEQTVITGLAIDQAGRLLVADTGRQRIVTVGGDGTPVVTYEGTSGLINGFVSGVSGEGQPLLVYASGELVCQDGQ